MLRSGNPSNVASALNTLLHSNHFNNGLAPRSHLPELIRSLCEVVSLARNAEMTTELPASSTEGGMACAVIASTLLCHVAQVRRVMLTIRAHRR